MSTYYCLNCEQRTAMEHVSTADVLEHRCYLCGHVREVA